MAWITYVCIVLCFVNFLREMSVQSERGREEALIECGALYPPYVEMKHQYWRLITAGFVHFSWWHLLMNMYVLWQLGTMLEGVLGEGMYALLLFGSVFVGNLFSCYMGDNEHTISGGMSTGLYGLMAFEIVFLAARVGWGGIFRYSGVVYTIIVNLLMNFLPGVGWKGHLGGACAGILMAVLFLRVF